MRWYSWKYKRIAYASGYSANNICVTDHDGEWKRFGFGLYVLIRPALAQPAKESGHEG